MASTTAAIQGQVGQQVETGYDAFQQIGTDDFLKLIIAELQHQDPMNPTDTSDMLNQFNQIREIASNDKLTKTLEGVLLGQSISTASNLIGKLVEGMTSDGQKLIGQVDAAMVKNGEPSLLVAGNYIKLKNVLQIIDPALIATGETESAATDETAQETDELTDESDESEGPVDDTAG